MVGFERGLCGEIKALTRDAATDAFWAGRWSGMASALARALRETSTGDPTAGEADVLAEFDRMSQQFENPPRLVTEPSRPNPWIEKLAGRDRDA